MAISMLKIRRPLGRLIFNMGIAIPGKTVFLIETAPRFLAWAGASKSLSCGHISFKLISNGLCGKCITQTYLGEIYEHAFYACAIWETYAFSLKNYCGFNTKSYCSYVCGYHRRPQTLAEIWRNMGIWFGFRAVAARGKYPGFMLFCWW